MKKLLLAVSAALITGSIAFAQGSVEKTVLDLEHQWGKAVTASNGKALEPLLASEFVYFGSDGSMQTKAEFIALAAKFKWQVNEAVDEKVRVYGNTAIATGVWTGKGTDPGGKPINGHERYVDTWVKMPDGKWQCVAATGIPIK